MEWWVKALLCVLAYFVGAINFAIIFSKFKGTDIKKKGSGNPGTMNVMRSVGKLWGVLTFVCDCAKGIIFALLGRFLLQSYDWLFILGTITVFGHIFPVYSKFKGGKGVATSIGVFMTAYPVVGTLVLVALILMLLFIKYGFIGSISATSVMTVYSCIAGKDSVVVVVCSLILWLLVFLRHWSNIVRLIKGQENTLKLVGKNQAKDLNEKEINHTNDCDKDNQKENKE